MAHLLTLAFIQLVVASPQNDDNSSIFEFDGEWTLEAEYEDLNVSNSSSHDTDEIYYDNTARRWTGVDILISSFFFIAAGWLLMAIYHSSVILFILRLQARGELDVYDDNFGVYQFCGGRVTLHLGCMLRRYAVQLEQEQQNRQNGIDGENDVEQPQIRIMTRWERRCAIEKLLEKSGQASKRKEPKTIPEGCDENKPEGNNEEAPVCSICLCEFDDDTFQSPVCTHQFHKECIVEWLERRQNTECPCCRQPLISDDEVWEIVKSLRKERRKRSRKENGYGHRLGRWILKAAGFRGVVTVADDSNERTQRTQSAEDSQSQHIHRSDTLSTTGASV